MLAKFRTIACTSMAAVFAFVGVGIVGPCCPVFFYQPELPKRD